MSKVFYSPTDAQVNCLKSNSKIYIKIDFEKTVTSASSNNALPDDGDCSETCLIFFSFNFKVNYKIVFNTIHLCISWWIKNFDNIKMQHGVYVQITDICIGKGS
jgi:hypothetical protein